MKLDICREYEVTCITGDILKTQSAADVGIVERLDGIDILLVAILLWLIYELDKVICCFYGVCITNLYQCPFLITFKKFAIYLVVCHLLIIACNPLHIYSLAINVGRVEVSH